MTEDPMPSDKTTTTTTTAAPGAEAREEPPPWAGEPPVTSDAEGQTVGAGVAQGDGEDDDER
jgi:hypothetical protein